MSELDLGQIAEFIRKHITTKPIRVKREYTTYNPTTLQPEVKIDYIYVYINIFNVKEIRIEEMADLIILTIYYLYGSTKFSFDRKEVMDLIAKDMI
jgi:hypothetical protein